jgi:hypothetical protein
VNFVGTRVESYKGFLFLFVVFSAEYSSSPLATMSSSGATVWVLNV